MAQYSIRKAYVTDVAVIHGLVRDFAQENLMLSLSFGDITERIRDFHLAEDENGCVVGCAALHVTWEGLAEVRSLAVLRTLHGEGLGRRLIKSLLEEATAMKITEVFTLTFVPGFFAKLGFEEIDRATLPHKVWHDCIKCPLFPDCGETAMLLKSW